MYICNWVTPLLSWARSALMEFGVWRFGLGQTKQEQKHWVTKCHLEIFLNVALMIIVSCLLFLLLSLFFLMWWHMISSFSSEAKLSVGNPQVVSENTSHGSMGLQTVASHTGIPTLTYLRYLCVSCVHVSVKNKQKTCCFTFSCSLWPRTHDHTERIPLYLHAAVGERIIDLCESIPKWLTDHFCAFTLL